MTGVFGPFGVWQPDQPTPPPLQHWRPGRGSVLAAVAVAVLLAAAGVLVQGHRGREGGLAPVAWSDPTAVATVFVQRYATHEPRVCELVTSALRARLDGEGRCAGPVRGRAPQLAVMSAQTCGDVHDVTALVSPEGEFGARYVSVTLEATVNRSWLVRSFLAFGDSRVLTVPDCTTRR